MSAGHRHRHEIDQGRVRELHTLMGLPWFHQSVAAYNQLDFDHDVPYVGGSKIDWKTVCFDRKFAQAAQSGQFIVGGRSINPLHPGVVHEAVEGSILHHWEQVRAILGWPETGRRYVHAHDVADHAERAAVEHLGVDWQLYQSAWKPFIRMDEHEQITNPPQGLLLDPYQGDNKMMTILMRAGGRTSEQIQSPQPAVEKAMGL